VRPADVEAKISQFREVVEQVCRDLFHESLLSISIGVAHFLIDGNDAEQLLAEADRRMYKEKQMHKPINTPITSTLNQWVSTIQ
jgi:GGDEF domain-containing protein